MAKSIGRQVALLTLNRHLYDWVRPIKKKQISAANLQTFQKWLSQSSLNEKKKAGVLTQLRPIVEEGEVSGVICTDVVLQKDKSKTDLVLLVVPIKLREKFGGAGMIEIFESLIDVSEVSSTDGVVIEPPPDIEPCNFNKCSDNPPLSFSCLTFQRFSNCPDDECEDIEDCKKKWEEDNRESGGSNLSDILEVLAG